MQSKASRDSEALRKQNEAECRESMRETVANLQAELAKYKKALEILAHFTRTQLVKTCPDRMEYDWCDARACEECLRDWALSEASK